MCEELERSKGGKNVHEAVREEKEREWRGKYEGVEISVREWKRKK